MISISSKQQNNQMVMKQNVIVVHNIYKQWATAIENYTTFKYFGINNKKTLEKFEEDRNKLSFQENDIILVSSTRYNTFTRYYSSYGNQKIFSRVFFDEADTIKIPGCEKLNASFTGLLHQHLILYAILVVLNIILMKALEKQESIMIMFMVLLEHNILKELRILVS